MCRAELSDRIPTVEDLCAYPQEELCEKLKELGVQESDAHKKQSTELASIMHHHLVENRLMADEAARKSQEYRYSI